MAMQEFVKFSQTSCIVTSEKPLQANLYLRDQVVSITILCTITCKSKDNLLSRFGLIEVIMHRFHKNVHQKYSIANASYPKPILHSR